MVIARRGEMESHVRRRPRTYALSVLPNITESGAFFIGDVKIGIMIFRMRDV
jgi:hypothetical protein